MGTASQARILLVTTQKNFLDQVTAGCNQQQDMDASASIPFSVTENIVFGRSCFGLIHIARIIRLFWPLYKVKFSVPCGL